MVSSISVALLCGLGPRREKSLRGGLGVGAAKPGEGQGASKMTLTRWYT